MPNKAFKADSQRSAISVRLSLGVYGGMVKFRGGVAHYLTRRYVLGGHVGISKGQGNFWRFSETYCKAV
ncbi:hypothetical protein CGK17_22835 [Vibrio parahaemolyticus]|nr:hypothetical protein CGK17_22835 [Vibrio parahaemolyticus]TOF97190.1 hypothetical protein CGJ10_22600 [Vibrio parahaemolyticus]